MLRRLLLLIGLACVFAGLPAPLGAAEPVPAAPGADGIIYPRNSPEARTGAAAGGTFPVWGTLGIAAVLVGTGLYLLKRGQWGGARGAEVRQRLAIEETRPLGNKQFLAVASYGGRRMLLAVCPGRIDLLCRLDESDPAVVAPAKVETVGSLSDRAAG